MVKPFEPEELVAQVEASLNKHFASRDRATLMATTKEQKSRFPRCTPDRAEGCAVCSKGLANRDIADELNVSQRTVESHVSNMLGKTVFTTALN